MEHIDGGLREAGGDEGWYDVMREDLGRGGEGVELVYKEILNTTRLGYLKIF